MRALCRDSVERRRVSFVLDRVDNPYHPIIIPLGSEKEFRRVTL